MGIFLPGFPQKVLALKGLLSVFLSNSKHIFPTQFCWVKYREAFIKWLLCNPGFLQVLSGA